MIEKISWEKFRECGVLWFVNTVLHLFGLAIVVDIEDDGTISDAYPAECKFRGFDEDTNDKGYRNLTEYIVENKDRLLKDTEAPSESGGEHDFNCGIRSGSFCNCSKAQLTPKQKREALNGKEVSNE